jgi:hypothetical protein
MLAANHIQKVEQLDCRRAHAFEVGSASQFTKSAEISRCYSMFFGTRGHAGFLSYSHPIKYVIKFMKLCAGFYGI